ncbi:MAG: APC family permease, partial [Acidobacteria bacterium]|nr:APC family permease [Acidobacteriota bacterium]
AYLGRLLPGADKGWHGAAIGAAVIGLCLLWNLAGGRAIGEGSLIMLFVMLAPFAVLTIAAFLHHASGGETTGHLSIRSSNLLAALLVCMWNYMGYDNAANVGGEVENPQRTYPLAIIGTIALVAVGYELPIIGMSFTGVPPSQWTTGSWATLGGMVAGKWLMLAIVAGGMVSSFGQFNSLLMSYSRLPLAMAHDGLLPRVFSRVQPSTGAPWVAIVACAVLYGACLGIGFDRLVTLDVLLWGASLVLEFMALVILRIREPETPRPFRVPGGLAGTVLVGVVPTALLIFAGSYAEHEQIFGVSVWLFGSLVMAAGVLAYGICMLARRQ